MMKSVVVLALLALGVMAISKSTSNFGQSRSKNGKTEHQKCTGDGTEITECDGTTHPGSKADANSCQKWCSGDSDFDFADSNGASSVSSSSFGASRTVNGVTQHQKCAGDGTSITECDGSKHPGAGRASKNNCKVWCDGEGGF